MSRRRQWLARFLTLSSLCCGITSMLADTVTTADTVTCNGRIVLLDQSNLQFEARFVGETDKKIYTIPRDQIRLLEFNENYINSRAPRGPFMVRDGNNDVLAIRKKEATPASVKPGEQSLGLADIVFMKQGGGQRTGHVVSIDAREVHIDGLPAVPKALVHSIQLAIKP